MELKWSQYPFKPFQNLKFISVIIWPGCTELTPTNWMWPVISLWGPSGVWHTSWRQLPRPSSSGRCPHNDQWQSFPLSILVHPFFTAHKSKGPAGSTIFPMCTRVSTLMLIHNDIFYKRLELIYLTIVRIHRLVYFWIFLVKVTQFIWISCSF